MKDVKNLINELVSNNEYLETDEERENCKSALCGAVNWGHKQDRAMQEYLKIRKRSNLVY
jgi:hypothetical protein